MSMDELKEKIVNKQAIMAVVGLGYVGLPLAAAFARAGFRVIGIELKSERVAAINRGESPFGGEEPGLAGLIHETVAVGRLRAMIAYPPSPEIDIFLVAVETPVDENNQPQYHALRQALQVLGVVLQPGALVIIESTLAPGTMRKLVRPALESASGLVAGRDFYLGHCPERVMPGRLLENLRGMNRVVGGMDPSTSEAMAALYSHIVQADLDQTDWITAELVKTVENAYRDVQIAFANETALVCEAVGGDAWRVRELVNKSPYRQMHLPGAGVGGHCIPKDPWLLAYGANQAGVELRLVPAARAINNTMPQHVTGLLTSALAETGGALAGSKILVMGYAYLEDADDVRNSPSAALVDILQRAGAKVVVHDPYVSPFNGDLLSLAPGCEAAVVMVRHHVYQSLDLAELKAVLRQPILVDGRHLYDPTRLRADGWIVRTIGIP